MEHINPFIFVAEFSPDLGTKIEWLTELRPQVRAGCSDPSETWKYFQLCSHPITETSIEDSLNWQGLLIKTDDEDSAHANFDDPNVRQVPVDTQLWPAASALYDQPQSVGCLFRCFMHQEAMSISKTMEFGGGGASGMMSNVFFDDLRDVVSRIFEEVPQILEQNLNVGGGGCGGGGGGVMSSISNTKNNNIANMPSGTPAGVVGSEGGPLHAAATSNRTPINTTGITSTKVSPQHLHAVATGVANIQVVSFTAPQFDHATILACVFQIRDPDVRAETRSLAVALCHSDFATVAKHSAKLVDGLVSFAATLIRESYYLPKTVGGQLFQPDPLFLRFAHSWLNEKNSDQFKHQPPLPPSSSSASGGSVAREGAEEGAAASTTAARTGSDKHENNNNNNSVTDRKKNQQGSGSGDGAGAGGGRDHNNIIDCGASDKSRSIHESTALTGAQSSQQQQRRRKVRVYSQGMKRWHNSFVQLLTMIVGPPVDPLTSLLFPTVSITPLIALQQQQQQQIRALEQQLQFQQSNNNNYHHTHQFSNNNVPMTNLRNQFTLQQQQLYEQSLSIVNILKERDLAFRNTLLTLRRFGLGLPSIAADFSQMNIMTELLSALFKGELVMILPAADYDTQLASDLAAALASLLPPAGRKVLSDVPIERIEHEEPFYNIIAARWSPMIDDGFLSVFVDDDDDDEEENDEENDKTAVVDDNNSNNNNNNNNNNNKNNDNINTKDQNAVTKSAASCEKSIAPNNSSRSNDNNNRGSTKFNKRIKKQAYSPREGAVVVKVSYDGGVVFCKTSDGYPLDCKQGNDIPLPKSVPAVVHAIVKTIVTTPIDEPLRTHLCPVLEMAQQLASGYVALWQQFLESSTTAILIGGEGGGGGGGARRLPPASTSTSPAYPIPSSGSSSAQTMLAASCRSPRQISSSSMLLDAHENSNINHSNNNHLTGTAFRSKSPRLLPVTKRDSDGFSDGGYSNAFGNDSFDERTKALLLSTTGTNTNANTNTNTTNKKFSASTSKKPSSSSSPAAAAASRNRIFIRDDDDDDEDDDDEQDLRRRKRGSINGANDDEDNDNNNNNNTGENFNDDDDQDGKASPQKKSSLARTFVSKIKSFFSTLGDDSNRDLAAGAGGGVSKRKPDSGNNSVASFHSMATAPVMRSRESNNNNNINTNNNNRSANRTADSGNASRGGTRKNNNSNNNNNNNNNYNYSAATSAANYNTTTTTATAPNSTANFANRQSQQDRCYSSNSSFSFQGGGGGFVLPTGTIPHHYLLPQLYSRDIDREDGLNRDQKIFLHLIKQSIPIEERSNYALDPETHPLPRPKLLPSEALLLFHRLNSHLAVTLLSGSSSSRATHMMTRMPCEADFVCMMHLAKKSNYGGTGSSKHNNNNYEKERS